MKSIAQIIDGPVSEYTGSEATKSLISEQIKERWGESELKNYDPFHNARTFHSWLKLGFKVRKGEKALRSITFIETKDAEGNILKRVKRPCYIFYYRQVQKIDPEKSHEENNDD